jgi:hypothetical protein
MKFWTLTMGLLAATALLASVSAPGAAAPATGQITIVQAVPGSSMSVAIDGATKVRDAEVGAVLGPYSLPAGPHEVVFTGATGGPMSTTIEVQASSSSDVVLHLPAARGGDPVVNTYETPLSPIGPGKARVLVAHTATVAPADVVVDGATVFTNIANGEYADADVPAGQHTASLVPTGTTGDPILGPLTVDLAAGTATMIYAVGSPTNGSMDVISHEVRLAADGTVAPERIDTGSAGLAAFLRVTPFGPG